MERTYQALHRDTKVYREEMDDASRSRINLTAATDENGGTSSTAKEPRKLSWKSFLSFRAATPPKAIQTTDAPEIGTAGPTGSKWGGSIFSISHPELINRQGLNDNAHKDARGRKGFGAIFSKNSPESNFLPSRGPSTRNATAGRERSRNSRIFSLPSANLPTQIPEIESEPEARRRTRTPPDINARHRRSWMPSTNASSLRLSSVEEIPAEAHRRKRTSWHILSRPEPSFTVLPRPEPTTTPGHG